MATRKAPAPPSKEQHVQELLREFREVVAMKGWTQVDVVRHSVFPLVKVGRWLRGDSAPRSEESIQALEKFLARHRAKK